MSYKLKNVVIFLKRKNYTEEVSNHVSIKSPVLSILTNSFRIVYYLTLAIKQ